MRVSAGESNLNDKWGVTAQGKQSITNTYKSLGGAPYVKDMFSAADSANIQLDNAGVIEVMEQHKFEGGWNISKTQWNYGNIKNKRDEAGRKTIGSYANRKAGLEAYFSLLANRFTEAAVYLQNSRLNPLEFGVALQNPDGWYPWCEVQRDPLYAAKFNNDLAGQVVVLRPEGE